MARKMLDEFNIPLAGLNAAKARRDAALGGADSAMTTGLYQKPAGMDSTPKNGH